MMSPPTLAITRSMISPGEERANTTARLTRGMSKRGFMVHLGSGHQDPDELALRLLRLAARQQRMYLDAAFLQSGVPCGLPRLHPQDMVSQRRLHDLAGRPGLEREGRLLQGARELTSGKSPHQASFGRFGASRPRAGQDLEALRVLH